MARINEAIEIAVSQVNDAKQAKIRERNSFKREVHYILEKIDEDGDEELDLSSKLKKLRTYLEDVIETEGVYKNKTENLGLINWMTKQSE